MCFICVFDQTLAEKLYCDTGAQGGRDGTLIVAHASIAITHSQKNKPAVFPHDFLRVGNGYEIDSMHPERVEGTLWERMAAGNSGSWNKVIPQHCFISTGPPPLW